MKSIEMLTVYGTSDCSYCTKAKQLANRYGIAVQYINVHENPEVLETFMKKGWKTVPQIMHEDTHVGGYTDLVEYLK